MVYVSEIAKLLLQNGVQYQDRAVIYSKNSPLWLLADMAIQFAGAVAVPVYETLGLDNIVYCINMSRAKFVFVSADYFPNVVASLSQLETVATVFCFDDVHTEQTKQQIHKMIAN